MSRNRTFCYLKEKQETACSVFLSMTISLSCHLLNYAQHFSKSNSFAEKGPEISEEQKFKFNK